MTNSSDQSNLDAPHLLLVMWRAFHAVRKVDQESVASTELGVSDFAVLESLLHKGPMPVNTIGKKVLLTSGSISSAVDRLEKRSLVRRRQDEEDRRVFHVELTPAGEALIEKAFAAHAERLEEVFSCLDGSEKSEFLRLLRKVGKHAATISPIPR